jgi:hypothetical protein
MSSVSKVKATREIAGKTGFSTTSTLAVGCTQPRIKLIRLSHSTGTKQPDTEADEPHSSVVELRSVELSHPSRRGLIVGEGRT